MSEVPFFKTRMGNTFYEHTMPDLVQQLTRLNDLLDKIVERLPEPKPEQPSKRET